MTSTMTEPISSMNSNSRYNLYGWKHVRCGGILSRPIFAYVILCICTFIQNFSVNGANNAVISTLERVFYLNSVQSGLFLALYDLATVFSAPLVGYLGAFYSSPIFFSLNMIVVSIGNIVIASSHFLQRDNRVRLNSFVADTVLFDCGQDPLQTGNFTDLSCLRAERLSNASQNAKILLYLGNFINGIGSVALFTIGVVYIERIFPRKKAAYCQAIYFAVGTVGGALGIVVTGRFLLLYTRLIPRRRLPSWLTPTHPLWIGCWWLPYFIYGGLCFIIGIFVSGLPNFTEPGVEPSRTNGASTIVAQPVPVTKDDYLTDETTIASSSVSDHYRNNGHVNHAFSTETLDNPPTELPISLNSRRNIRENCRNLCSVLGELMKNIRFVFIVLVNLFEGILLKGFVPFITKYFEYQHQIDTSTATLITGAIALISVIIGCPLGAFFMNKYSWTSMQCARVCTIILLISSFLFLFLIFSCPELKFQQTSCSSINTACCHNIYHPVCNINNPQEMYLSPCHFGCKNQTTLNDNSTIYYSSCHCADQTVVSEIACQFRRIPCVVMFALTLTGATFVVFFTAFIQVPLLQVLLYSVPLAQQSMALAIRQTIVRVLGQTTGPLLFGFVFDRTCLVWLVDCYARRTCKVYENRQMSLSMALSGFTPRFLSSIACAVVFLHWKYRHSNAENITSNPSSNDQAHKNEDNEITRF